MARLYLMRHATAEAGEPGQDTQRQLTEEGRAEARDAALGLKRLKVVPDYFITSPYVRARQTGEEVAKILAPGVLLKEMHLLTPESDPRLTSAGLKEFQKAQRLLFFGHEPHLSAWVSWLIDKDAAASCLMKKAGVACIETGSLPPKQAGGTLRWLATPKQLALIGRAS